MIKNKKFKTNKCNLILSAAIGYRWNDLKIFVKSLRKFKQTKFSFKNLTTLTNSCLK